MSAIRTSAREPGPRMRQPDPRSKTEPFRTGTVLRTGRWLPATAVLVLTGVVGISHAPVASSAADSIADYSGPGAIGASRRPQPGPCPESVIPDAVQPVEIRGPKGLRIAIETAAGWSPLQAEPLRRGLVVGRAYRLRVAGIPGRAGEEIYPSIRVLAKLVTPPGMAWRFPVEIAIDADDLVAALGGGHVRRVVYASCESEGRDVMPSSWFDVAPGDDPLEVARTLGDPVAEVVIGNRIPAPGMGP
jgi:hypothetical protein